jgi:glycosyltransferase involved in cell wall biosynthesis
MTRTPVPGIVRDVELSAPLPAIAAVGPDGTRAERVWLLVRMYTEPIGSLLLDLPEAGLSPAQLATAVYRGLGTEARRRQVAAQVAQAAGSPPPYLARRAEVLRTAPPVTVVICTRDHPEQLARCLDSLLAQQYPQFRVLVVDNAPTSSATYEVVRRAAARGPVDYVVEPRPGLSRARNRAVAACPGQILAWIDDDEVADPYWLSEIARALADHPEADAVSGAIVPAELATDAQLWFEQFGGHSKGRGFTPAEFSPATAHRQSPLYPLPPFGTGGNMAFRPGVVERIGGFDPALGAGTPAMGSEDTLAFTQLLHAGGTVVYQPTAVVRHYHRRDLAGLRRQLVGYGTGLTAAYASLLLADPRVIWPLLRLVPTALRDLLGAGSLRVAGLAPDFPRTLLHDNLRGMLRGPLAYLRGRRQARGRRRGNASLATTRFAR